MDWRKQYKREQPKNMMIISSQNCFDDNSIFDNEEIENVQIARLLNRIYVY